LLREKRRWKIAVGILPNGNGERVAADLGCELGSAPAIEQRSSKKQSKKQNRRLRARKVSREMLARYSYVRMTHETVNPRPHPHTCESTPRSQIASAS
jgi:hypothetical protein